MRLVYLAGLVSVLAASACSGSSPLKTADGDADKAVPSPDGGAQPDLAGSSECLRTNLRCLRQDSATDGGVRICTDISEPPICEDGTWRCQVNTLPSDKCSCVEIPGCSCPNGIRRCDDGGSPPDRKQTAEVHPEAGPGTSDAREAGTEVPFEAGPDDATGKDAPGADGSKDACDVGCAVQPGSGSFCQQGEVQWTCGGSYDFALFNASCRDTVTGVQRYCCPPSFLAACH